MDRNLSNCAGDAPVALSTLEEYWRALSGSNRLPARTEVDPHLIDAALPYSMIVEEVSPRVARIRVAGEAISRRFDFDLRGMPLAGLFSLESRVRLGDNLEIALKSPALVQLSLARNGALLVLPLTDQYGLPTRALCAVSCPFGGRGRLVLDQETKPRVEPIRALQRIVSRNEKGLALRPALRLVVDNA